MRPIILALLAISLGAQAQGWSRRPRRESPPTPPVFEHIQKAQADRLMQHLGIPEERAQAMAARWSRFLLDSSGLLRKTRELRRQMEAILKGPGTEEEKNLRVKPVLELFLSARQQLHDGRRIFEDELRSGLTPAQQARLIGMIDDFQRELQEGMREAFRRGRGPQLP